MAGLLIFVGEHAMELDAMATVGDIRAKLEDLGVPKHNTLLYQEKELSTDTELLADLGIGNECRIEMGLGCPHPVFNKDLPHKYTAFEDNNKQAKFIGSSKPTCVFGRDPIQDGVAVWYHVVSSPQGSYYGVGLSPMPEDPGTAQFTRVANDGDGIGWSFNRNGCCYGAFKQMPRGSGSDGLGLLAGDFVRFEVTFSTGEVVVEHLRGDKHKAAGQGTRCTRVGNIGKVDRDLYPAVFFCNEKGSVIRFVEGPQAFADIEAYILESKAKKEREEDEAIQAVLGILGSDYDKQKIRNALQTTAWNKERAINLLFDS